MPVQALEVVVAAAAEVAFFRPYKKNWEDLAAMGVALDGQITEVDGQIITEVEVIFHFTQTFSFLISMVLRYRSYCSFHFNQTRKAN